MIRNTAYKFWIKDILKAKSGTDSGVKYFDILGRQVLRVNLIANVIDKFVSAGYGAVMLDDSSGNIRVKVWGDDLWIIEKLGVGDVVNVLGRLAEFNNEIYVRPEIAKKTALEWAHARRLELNKEFGAVSENLETQDAKPVVEEVVIHSSAAPSLTARERVFDTVAKNENGVLISEVIEKTGLKKEDAESALLELIKEGEIFECEEGKVRVV